MVEDHKPVANGSRNHREIVETIELMRCLGAQCVHIPDELTEMNSQSLTKRLTPSHYLFLLNKLAAP